jgi:hypothetical protein
MSTVEGDGGISTSVLVGIILRSRTQLTCHIMKSLKRLTSLVRIKMSNGGDPDFCVDRLPNKTSDVISLFRLEAHQSH